MKSTIRFNVTMSEQMKNWFEKRANEYGMSISSVMTMALAQYKEQQEVMQVMNNTDLMLAIEKAQKNKNATTKINDSKKED